MKSTTLDPKLNDRNIILNFMLQKALIALFSLVYFILLPLNYIFSDSPYWVFVFVSILVFVVFWIIPLICLTKKKLLVVKNTGILIIINIIIWCIVVFSGEIYSAKLKNNLIEKRDKIQQYMDQWLIKVKR